VGVDFFDSSEFRMARPLAINGLVSALYRGLLGRDPDPDGQSSWTTLIRQGRIAVAVDGFVDSAEFQALVPDRHDPTAVRAVIRCFYTEILGLPPDPVGLAAWVEYLTATGSFEFATNEFLSSPEFEHLATVRRDSLPRDPGARPGLRRARCVGSGGTQSARRSDRGGLHSVGGMWRARARDLWHLMPVSQSA
jgi:hypothetical protein